MVVALKSGEEMKIFIFIALLFISSNCYSVAGSCRRTYVEHIVTVNRTVTGHHSATIQTPHRVPGNGGKAGSAGKITLSLTKENINASFIVELSHDGLVGKNGASAKCPLN